MGRSWSRKQLGQGRAVGRSGHAQAVPGIEKAGDVSDPADGTGRVVLSNDKTCGSDPAFPCEWQIYSNDFAGLTKRELFALILCANSNIALRSHRITGALREADELLKVLEDD